MTEFSSMGALALHLAAAAATEIKCLEKGLEQCGKHLVETMQGEIGHYQSDIGQFAAWAPLAESTEAAKAAHGYPADSPLLASGEMQGSFSSERHGLEVIAGSKDPKMVYHEFGTLHMPPREVVGPAVLRSKEYIRRRLGAAAVEGLIGGVAIHRLLGYDKLL
ncbi:hypothetical protein [Pseudomonas sp. MWU12-2345]|uniref:hypothetical protein n=1 Tax=Pseudomonas sp. MWU12-2345 TaxID=2928689 RepID=UPI00200BA6CD|nr:hypothetical protein [Pseudomonas sp. MWU12-2345]